MSVIFIIKQFLYDRVLVFYIRLVVSGATHSLQIRNYKNFQIKRKERNRMQLEKLSKNYSIRRLDSNDVNTIFKLFSKNITYYQYCPPFVTKERIMKDLKALPSGKTEKDKYFLGYYENTVLIAVLDLIIGYPEINTVYIGLFMMDTKVQGRGIGTKIIEELCDYLKKTGFQKVELAWVKGNPQSERFWIKNRFNPIEERSSNVADHVIAAIRELN